MPLIVRVYLNETHIADATAVNLSDLKDVSDYAVWTLETAEPNLGIKTSEVAGKVIGHNRKQSVWALVEKMAAIGKNKG
ncbi:MAG: hypothetical protein COA52_11620 [Hyphomicrobiales bacterium]|nr:hypothetical protein [Hyphomicrobiales bacterium]PCJ89734.1 MAG: hypothetical protein COA52_11620 [Hyphomicrobiales bacterium]